MAGTKAEEGSKPANVYDRSADARLRAGKVKRAQQIWSNVRGLDFGGHSAEES